MNRDALTKEKIEKDEYEKEIEKIKERIKNKPNDIRSRCY